MRIKKFTNYFFYLINPIFFGVASILGFFILNLSGLPLSLSFRPLFLAAIISVIISILLKIFINDYHRANTFSSVSCFFFFLYPWPIVNEFLIGNGCIVGIWHRYVFFFIWLLIIYLIFKIISRIDISFKQFSRLLFLSIFLVTSFYLFTLFKSNLKQQNNVILDNLPKTLKPIYKPNIYYIVLDAYARTDILQDYYNYDNKYFESFLQENNFFIATNSYANYPYTELSISSSLNFDFLENFIENLGANKNDLTPLIKTIKRGRIIKFLKNNDYDIISYFSGFSATEIDNCDTKLSPKFNLSFFENFILNRTPLSIFTFDYQFELHRKSINFILDELQNITQESRPKFIFAHIFSPHPPFVFDKTGKKPYQKRGFDPFDGKIAYNKDEYVKMYADQIDYLNHKLIKTIKKILINDNSAVIILQGDHGPRSMLNFHDIKDSSIKEAFAIFLGIYTSGNKEKQFYESLSPVNIFRIILNRYFDTELEKLQDSSYFSSKSDIYEFVDVSDKF